jgi:hypothetical protein
MAIAFFSITTAVVAKFTLRVLANAGHGLFGRPTCIQLNHGKRLPIAVPDAIAAQSLHWN